MSNRCVLAALLVVGLSGSGSLVLADIGPDAYGYIAKTVDFQFENIVGMSGTTRVMVGQDEGYGSVTLPFAFDIYGQSYTSNVFYSPNGLLSFGYNLDSSAFNKNITTTALSPDVPTIAVLWDDWTFGAAGADAVYYNTLGTAGNRRFVIQWNQAVAWDARNNAVANPVTFQAVLYEGSNDIQLNYLDATTVTGHTNGASATVGIRGKQGQTNGNHLQWSYNQAVIGDQLSILFTTNVVPAPAAVVLGGLGLCLVGWIRWRNTKA